MPDYVAKGDRENWYWKVRAENWGMHGPMLSSVFSTRKVVPGFV
jgi:hypothetical protein